MPISDELGRCITALLDDGFALPLYFTCMAVNGVMVYGRYSLEDGEEDLHCDILASHEVEDEMTLPLNILFMDHVGKAARIVFDEDGTSEEIQVFLP
jgi:hypothetical protein